MANPTKQKIKKSAVKTISRDEKPSRQYQLRASGWCAEVSCHQLSKNQTQQAIDWINTQGYQPKDILGSMEGAIAGYNCYSTNVWQSGCVPLVGSIQFVLVDDQGKKVFALNGVGGARGGRRRQSKLPTIELPPNRKNLLIYFEESKGSVATWIVESPTRPKKSDFVFDIAKIKIPNANFEYISGVRFQGADLEQDYELENVRGKAAYSKLFLET